jgi:hypothetical protein
MYVARFSSEGGEGTAAAEGRVCPRARRGVEGRWERDGWDVGAHHPCGTVAPLRPRRHGEVLAV